MSIVLIFRAVGDILSDTLQKASYDWTKANTAGRNQRYWWLSQATAAI
jgi:hypothetical protein